MNSTGSCLSISQNATAPKLNLHIPGNVGGLITSQNATAPKRETGCCQWSPCLITSQNATAPKQARVDLKDWERKGIDALAKKGKKVVVPEEDPDAPANIDLKVDGALWELKNVTNVSSSVGNQLGRSRKKWWKFDKTTGSRTIFTMYDCKNSAEEIAEAIKKRLRPNENAVLIDENGNIIEIKSEFVS